MNSETTTSSSEKPSSIDNKKLETGFVCHELYFWHNNVNACGSEIAGVLFLLLCVEIVSKRNAKRN
jgi:hypothetical protein